MSGMKRSWLASLAGLAVGLVLATGGFCSAAETVPAFAGAEGFGAASAQAADWPMYRADAARSGYTPAELSDQLSLSWIHRVRCAPAPAWPSSRRMLFDRAYQPVVAGGTLYFGSSADGKVYALDAATGRGRWTFFTDGPVRFAPVAWRDRLFAASDDGYLYCLAAADGSLLWKLRGGPRDEMLLGNDRMISCWPARGGPVLAEGVLYFGAGIWPSEDIFIHAVDPVAGKVLWCNDSSGPMEMDQPHPGARATSGAAAHGHLAVTSDALLVPTGRAVPAVFNRADGRFRYLHLQPNRAFGGSEVMAIDGHFVNGGAMFAIDDGARQLALGAAGSHPSGRVTHNFTWGIQMAAHPRWVVYSSQKQLTAVQREGFWVDKEVVDRKGEKKTVKALGQPAWTAQLPFDAATAMIVAGDRIIVGGRDLVAAVDVTSGQTTWTAKAEGSVYGLALADARLYVSTDRGTIQCFDGISESHPAVIEPEKESPKSDQHKLYATAAEEIIRRTGVTEGYCLDLACGGGQLALELARRTKLQIYGVEEDAATVQSARRMLDEAGLYGVRVTVHQADPTSVSYPNYFADLVVSGRSLTEGPDVVPEETAARLQRPYGGIVCVGRPGAMKESARGPLEGAADWTHLYADCANTVCSGDRRLQAPLAMLWFRQTDLFMPTRHGRGPAPLVRDGRMFVEGVNVLRAVNVYNGRTLWEYPLEGILRPYHQDHLTGVASTGSNFCLGKNRVYVRTAKQCLCLDAGSGRKVTELQAPLRPDGKPGTWGYIAWRDETLFGSLANEEHLVKAPWRAYRGRLDMSRVLSESILFFALDARTGKLKWTYQPEHSIRHNAIAIGNGKVYLIDRPLAWKDVQDGKLHAEANRRAAAEAEDKAEVLRRLTAHPFGTLVALDAETGKVVWRTNEDVFGTLLALSEKHGVLLMSYQPTIYKLDSELGWRMAAIRASDGARLWDVKAKYLSRPLLNDRTIYAQPGAWDLLTGKRHNFSFPRSHGCGILSGSERLLLFRSATLGFVDLGGTQTTENYGGIRPGCWINAIPAGGLVLLADAASWCTCSYLNQATIALQPRSNRP